MSKHPANGVTDPFSWMRARYLLGWLIVAVLVTAVATFLIRIFGPGTNFGGPLGELLSSVAGHLIVLLVVWMYLRHSRVSYIQLLGPLPDKHACFLALRLLPLLLCFRLAGFFLVAYPSSYLAPHLLDEFLKMKLFVTAANEQHQWLYDLETCFEIVFLGPVIEEVVFRGILLQRWTVKWNLPAAMWMSSMLFGICHGPSAVGAVVFGFVMAMLYIETGSLLVPTVVHAANNAFVCLFRTLYLARPSWALQEFWSSAADIRNTAWIGFLFLVFSVPPMLFYLVRHWPEKSVTLPYFRGAALSTAVGTSPSE